MQTYAPWWIDLDETSAGPFLLLPCSRALPLIVGPHHADQLCLPAHVGKVHLGLLLTLPAPYEALIPKPLRPCFVRLAKPAAASAFFLALLHLHPLLARGTSSAAAPHDLLCCTWKRPALRAAAPAAQPCAPPCVSPSRAPPPGASSIAATPPGAACPGARAALV